ncbi:MAG: hypothetical protein RLZZ262_4, partial [Bacteroidota bacterium]
TASDPLTVWVDYTNDLESMSVLVDYGASGGTGPYAYTFEVNGMPWWGDELDSIIFYDFLAVNVVVCATDANGCSSCEQFIADPSFIPCTLNLNTNVDGNLLTVSAELMFDDGLSGEYVGYLNVGLDSTYVMDAYFPYSVYLPTIGTYNVCYELHPDYQEFYPICPASICEEITVTELNSDCAADFVYNQNNGEISFYSTSTGFFDAVLWDFGNGETSTLSNPIVNLLPGIYVVTLEVSNALSGCSSTVQETITVLAPAHICMELYYDDNQNGQQDLGEMPVDSLYVTWGNEIWLATDGVLDVWTNPGSSCISFGGEWSAIQVTQSPNWNACFMSDTYLLELAPGEELCPIVIGLYVPQTTICGTYYFDANINGVLDNGESGVAYAEIEVQWLSQNVLVTCDENGDYCIELPINNSVYMTPLLDGESSALIQPQFHYVYTYTSPEIANFGVYSVTNSIDIGVSLSPSNPVVPGFSTTYYATVQNYSNMPTTGTLFVYNALGQTTSYVNDGGSVEPNGASWVINLPAYGTASYSYTVTNSTSMVLGESAVTTASLNSVGTDINLVNNNATLQMTVIGSYDPNNKLANPAGVGPLGLISPSVNSIEYTINFQNTGTAPAVNIEVVDDLPMLLDPSSIQLLHTSHPATMLVQGQNVKWNFYNIMLADSMTNEPESHGHITFRVSPTNPLVNGQSISNEAYIYFDFNAPIITAPAVLTVDETIGVANVEPGAGLMVYPNPVSDEDLYIAGIKGTTDIFNASGQRVQTIQAQQAPLVISTSSLAPGLYVVHDTTTGQRITFVKQ